MINSRYCLIKINFSPMVELLTYIIVNELCFRLGSPFHFLVALGFYTKPLEGFTDG